MDTLSGILFDYNIYFENEHLKNINFENAHLENIFKIINIFLEKARSRPSSRLKKNDSCRKRGKEDVDYSGLDTVSGIVFDNNIYFENAHL